MHRKLLLTRRPAHAESGICRPEMGEMRQTKASADLGESLSACCLSLAAQFTGRTSRGFGAKKWGGVVRGNSWGFRGACSLLGPSGK